MKRILAVLMALMMLMTAAASAETVVSLADPVLTLNTGEAQTYDLTGIELAIAGSEIDGVPAAQIDINGNGSKLLGISVNVVEDKVLLSVDGVSSIYYAQLPEQVSEVTGGGLDLSGLDLSAVDLDLEALLGAIEMDGDTIRVPYTAVNDVLEAITPALSGLNIMGVDLSALSEAVAQLKESDSGITLEGTYVEGENGFSFSAAVIPVQGGEAGESVCNVSYNTDETGVSGSLDIPDQVSLYFSAQPTDEKVRVSIGGEGMGMGMELSAVVSVSEADVTFTKLEADGAIDIQSLTDEQNEALIGELATAGGGLIAFVLGAMSAAA